MAECVDAGVGMSTINTGVGGPSEKCTLWSSADLLSKGGGACAKVIKGQMP